MATTRIKHALVSARKQTASQKFPELSNKYPAYVPRGEIEVPSPTAPPLKLSIQIICGAAHPIASLYIQLSEMLH